MRVIYKGVVAEMIDAITEADANRRKLLKFILTEDEWEAFRAEVKKPYGLVSGSSVSEFFGVLVERE